MATLALSFAGQAIGGALGGPFGAIAGRALGALAGNAIDQALFSSQTAATPPDAIRLQNATEGGVLPRIYGWNRLAGNIIWATELARKDNQSAGAKGVTSPSDENTELLASFAVAFCQGEVTHLGRIWADGRLLDTEGLNVRFYPGNTTQGPDGLIAAKQGADATPAYRGTCYLVFEALPLSQFGNRIPQINAELCRAVGDLEPHITAISVIPGSTEFGYDPSPRIRILSPGVTASENAHAASNVSDWTISIDELQALCPNLKHVALVISWFGTDLRCGQCAVEPRTERADKTMDGVDWVVGGIPRSAATPVGLDNGSPAYGGTPSDASVLRAIADLKARGIKVTLYPFMMMDVTANNALADPYTGLVGQPSFPWRGRVTCDPAPGAAGTVDQTAAAAAQIAAFVGQATRTDFAAQTDTIVYNGPIEWSYRRFILHYAHLCALAGGVDAFLIGSELRGLTQTRGAANTFPFVDALKTLAADVRAVLGTGSKITYAADWSEYSGYQPADAPGDKFFHLDALWAAPEIDAVAIDNYMPLADWRDEENALDFAVGTPYRLDYLRANIAGGEGYEWHYASEADRQAQVRTPITDGIYAEDWVWRYKDIVNWWSQPHHDRTGGTRASLTTAWVPQSKPIWFTELGCAAVDKGANGPNAFPDPKSSENALPPFSNGSADPLAQRQFLRAHYAHWRSDSTGFSEASNPVSAVYGQRMLDTDRIYLWAWDARPYPAFPTMGDVWADGQNHERGHWLNGRLGAAAPDELLVAVANDYGTSLQLLDPGNALVTGYLTSGAGSLRDGLEQSSRALDLSLCDRLEGLAATTPAFAKRFEVASADLVENEGATVQQNWTDPQEEISRCALTFADRAKDFATTQITATNAKTGAQVRSDPVLVLDFACARKMAETLFAHLSRTQRQISISLPPDYAHIEPGDRLHLAELGLGDWMVTQVRLSDEVGIRAEQLVEARPGHIVGEERKVITQPAASRAIPFTAFAHLPALDGYTDSVLLAAAFARPWTGAVRAMEANRLVPDFEMAQSSTMGVLANDLPAHSAPLWDRSGQIEVTLFDGHLASATELDVLNGANRLTVKHDDGQWEVLGFSVADMVGTAHYRLSGLLRGLEGTPAGPSGASSGAPVVLLDTSATSIPLSNERLGQSLDLRLFAGARDSVGQSVSMPTGFDPVRPLAPVHLRARRNLETGDVAITWIRRSRIGGDSWTLKDIPLDAAPEAYRLEIALAGQTVRTFETGVASQTYLAADQTADFGGLPTTFDVSVRQLSAVFGDGHPTSLTFKF